MPGVGEQRGSDVRAYHFDAFGTVSWLSTVGQVLSNQRQYDFFGSLIGSTGSTWPASVGVSGAGGSARDDTDTGWHNTGGGSYLDPGGQGFPSKREVEVTDEGWPTDIPDGRDWFDKTTDFMSGLGDGVSMGLTAYVRGVMGTDEFVNTSSPQYGFGQAGAVAIDVISIGAGVKAIIGAIGHGHHIVPKQILRMLDRDGETWWKEIRKDYWGSTGRNVIRMPVGEHMAMHWWGRNGMGRYNPWWLERFDEIETLNDLEQMVAKCMRAYDLKKFR